MKKIILLVVLGCALVYSCTKKSLSDFEIIKEKLDQKGGGGGGGGDDEYCFVGDVWKKYTCDGAEYTLLFSQNKTGVMSFTGCEPYGVLSSRYEFNWSESNGVITYTYTYCEKPIGTTIATLTGGPQSYTCSSFAFTTGGDTWMR